MSCLDLSLYTVDFRLFLFLWFVFCVWKIDQHEDIMAMEYNAKVSGAMRATFRKGKSTRFFFFKSAAYLVGSFF